MNHHSILQQVIEASKPEPSHIDFSHKPKLCKMDHVVNLCVDQIAEVYHVQDKVNRYDSKSGVPSLKWTQLIRFNEKKHDVQHHYFTYFAEQFNQIVRSVYLGPSCRQVSKVQSPYDQLSDYKKEFALVQNAES